MSWPLPVLALVLVLGIGLPSLAEDIYHWKDEHGVLHFSDRPPPSGNAVRIWTAPADKPRDNAPPLSDRHLPRPFTGGVFWRIDNGRTTPSYLLGTIHSADPRVLAWPATVNEAFRQAGTFVMEMSLETDSFFKIGRAMMITNGSDLADLLGPADYRRLVDALASRPIPESLLRKLKPWVLMTMLSQPQSGRGEFMDLKLHRLAQSQGKRIFGLETAEEQLAVFDGMPIEDQVAMLRSTLRRLHELPEMMEALLTTYLAGDLRAIADLAESYMLKDGTPLERRFLLRLNNERNDRMVERLIAHIEKGDAFIAVGALHLAGRSGIVRQLMDRGFELSPVE